jgi:hypothetical protein
VKRIKAEYVKTDARGCEIPPEARFFIVEPRDYRKLLAVARAVDRASADYFLDPNNKTFAPVWRALDALNARDTKKGRK